MICKKKISRPITGLKGVEYSNLCEEAFLELDDFFNIYYGETVRLCEMLDII